MKKSFTLLCVGVGLLAIFIGIWLNSQRGTTESGIEKTTTEVANTTLEESETETLEYEVEPETDTCVLLDDFTGESNLRWYTVNDGVMGGLSDGVASIENNTLIHAGSIVTRGGGFSYVGTQLPDDILAGYSSLHVRLNTGGRTYAANFADSRSWRVTHQVAIPATSNPGWQEVTISFADTVPTIFSRAVNSTPLDASAVEELAFILSDGIDGSFQTEIDWVKVCK